MLRRAVNNLNCGFVHVISTAVNEVSNWNNSLVPVRLSRVMVIYLSPVRVYVPKEDYIECWC